MFEVRGVRNAINASSMFTFKFCAVVVGPTFQRRRCMWGTEVGGLYNIIIISCYLFIFRGLVKLFSSEIQRDTVKIKDRTGLM